MKVYMDAGLFHAVRYALGAHTSIVPAVKHLYDAIRYAPVRMGLGESKAIVEAIEAGRYKKWGSGEYEVTIY